MSAGTAPQTPHECLVAVLDHGAVRTERIELGPPAEGELDVAITLAALCGSDVHTINGDRPSEPLTALGHEGVGRVISVGGARTDLYGNPLNPGDRVALAMLTSCGRCDRCQAGLPMKCRDVFKYGHHSITHAPHASGMVATVVRMLRDAPVAKLDDRIADRQIVSAGCAVATAVAAVRIAQLDAGIRVGVLGAGAVGWYVAALTHDRRCQVTVVEPDPQRRALVARLGVATTDNSQDLADLAPEVTIEASGHPDAVTAAISGAPIGGRVICVGSVSPGSTTVTLDPALLVTRWLTVRGVHNYAPEDFATAVEWLTENTDRLPAELVSEPYRLDQLDQAVAAMVTGRHPRVAIQPQPPA